MAGRKPGKDEGCRAGGGKRAAPKAACSYCKPWTRSPGPLRRRYKIR